MTPNSQIAYVEKEVTYTLNLNGQIILIENVPARVNEETGEQFFSPSTVKRLQQTILDNPEPDHCLTYEQRDRDSCRFRHLHPSWHVHSPQ
jgi:YgiT-type zinc finger domain-containing protein